MSRRRRTGAVASSKPVQAEIASQKTFSWQTYWSLIVLVIVTLLVPHHKQILRPLFGSTLIESHTSSIELLSACCGLLLLKTASRCRFFVLAVMSVYYSTSTLVLRWLAEALLNLGAVKGAWMARLYFEVIPCVLKWIWLLVSIEETLLKFRVNGQSQMNEGRPHLLESAVLGAILYASIHTASSLSQHVLSSWLARISDVQPWLGVGFLIASVACLPGTRSSQDNLAQYLLNSSRTKLIFIGTLGSIACAQIYAPRYGAVPSYMSSQFAHQPILYSSPSSYILASAKSVTGQILVGEAELSGNLCRYLRADHSLLGGLWVGHARNLLAQETGRTPSESEIVKTAESIYSTFILQEIVRLADPQSNGPKRALIIGLGAGLSARALQLHGVNVTICEIDPIVYEFARDYFGVSVPEGGVFLQDARVYLQQTQSKFDYIIHDVFTGGSVPAALFTRECWESIRSKLTPTGHVAINFAGSLDSEALKMVVYTLLHSFNHCRAFEDASSGGTNFRNLVFICTTSISPIKFRQPVQADFLEYPSREIRRETLNSFKDRELDLTPFREGDETLLITDGKGEKRLERAQREEVVKHWEIMSQVIPNHVWAMY